MGTLLYFLKNYIINLLKIQGGILMERKNTLSIVQTSLMIAIITLVTMTVRIPTYAGYTHLGDSMIFIAVVLLGKKKSIIAAAVGMCLADILSGYMVWAPFTLVIKATMAYIAALIVFRGENNGDSIKNNIFAFTVAGIWMIFAYWIAGAFVTSQLLSENVTLVQGLVVSLKDVPANIAQALVGMIIAIPMIKMIKKTNYKF